MFTFRRKIRTAKRLFMIVVLIFSLMSNMYFLQSGHYGQRFEFRLGSDSDVFPSDTTTTLPKTKQHITTSATTTTMQSQPMRDVRSRTKRPRTKLLGVSAATPIATDVRTLNVSWKSPLRHFFNVCITDPHQTNVSTRQMFAHVTVHDRNYHKHALTQIRWQTYVHAVEMENYWVLDFPKNKSEMVLSSNVTWLNATAYFTPFFRDSNHIYATIHETSPLTFGQIRHGTALMPPSHRNLDRLLITKSIKRLKNDTRNALLASGFRAVSDFGHVMQEFAPLCFKNAIFGHPPSESPRDVDVIKRGLQRQFSINSSCSSHHVLLLQRAKTRVILNADEIAAAIQSQLQAQVVIENFDSKSFASQLEIVQCSTVFIGVQGAGLSWYRFLPHNAILLELYYDNWGPKFVSRASVKRPDIKGRTIHCESVTDESLWASYAKKWFDHEGDLNEDMREKIRRRSKENPALYGSVWKDSNVNCSVADVVAQLSLKKSVKGKKLKAA